MSSCEMCRVYSMFLNDQGMILDDVMHGLYEDKFYLIVNGSNQHKISDWMNRHCPKDVTISQHNKTHSFLAVQGPNAHKQLEDTFQLDLKDVKRFGITECTIHNQTVTLFRTGYTGEDGFELLVPNEITCSVWEDLILKGVTPCGLGARDSLRIEKGLPLYGHELSEIIHPYMTQYSWVVKLNKDFIGKAALEKQHTLPHLVTVGLELEGKNIARQDYKIQEGGYVSSGIYLPSKEKSIALAFVHDTHSEIGTEVTVLIRNKECKATVVKVPFV